MAAKKFTVSMEPELLNRLDRLVKNQTFRSRSHAVQVAVREKVERLEHSRLDRECRKLDPKTEQAMAEEDIVRHRKQRDILKLQGQVQWKGDLAAMRQSRNFG